MNYARPNSSDEMLMEFEDYKRSKMLVSESDEPSGKNEIESIEIPLYVFEAMRDDLSYSDGYIEATTKIQKQNHSQNSNKTKIIRLHYPHQVGSTVSMGRPIYLNPDKIISFYERKLGDNEHKGSQINIESNEMITENFFESINDIKRKIDFCNSN